MPSALDALRAHPQLGFLPALAAPLPEAEWFVVGGAVRDALLGRPVKDVDLLVRGVTAEALVDALSRQGSVAVVGRQFGVIAFTPPGGAQVDIALPRTELPGGSGAYRDVLVHADPHLSVEDDLARRDFAVNAMALRLADGSLIDPHGGREDLEKKTLRAVGDPAARFAEDLTRALRGLRLAVTLGFSLEPQTWEALVAAAVRLDETRGDGSRLVPREAVAAELVKSLEADPVACLDVWDRAGVLLRLMPELAPLRGCEQPKNFHSEGDVWTHTVMAVAALRSPGFAEFFGGARPSVRAVLGTLFHDIAKPDTAAVRDGKLTFYGHPNVGAAKARAIAERLKLSSAGVDPDDLAWLVKMHLVPNMLRLDEVRPATLHRHFLADPLLGRDLLHVAYADAAATVHEDGSADFGTLRDVVAAVDALAARHGTGRPRPLLSGGEIMALLGIGPGPEVAAAKAALWEAQLAGTVATKEEAARFVKALPR